MNDFQFDQAFHNLCRNLFELYPECEFILYNIASSLQKKYVHLLSSEEIILLSPAISLNLVVIDNGSAIFTNDNMMVYLLAREECKQRLLTKYNVPADFWDEFEKTCRESISEKKIRKLAPAILVALSKDFKKDVCKQILTLESNDFWMVYHAVTDSLPYLQINITSVIDLMTFIEKLTQKDMTRGLIYGAIQKLSMIQPQIGTALLYKLKESTDQGIISFMPAVLVGLSMGTGLKDVYEQANHLLEENGIFIQEGVFSLSLFDYNNEVNTCYLTKTLETYDSFLDSNTESQILGVVTKGYGNLLKYDERVRSKLSWLSHIGDPNIQFELSNILFHNEFSKNEKWYKDILITLSSADVQYKGITDNLSHCLHNYLLESPEFVFYFFTRWIQNRHYGKEEPSFVKLFNWVFSDLFNQNKWLIEKHITNWFNSNDSSLHRAAADVVQDFAINEGNFILNKEQLDKLSEDDIDFIIVKIMGYVHWNTMLCSLVFSVLQRTPESEKVNRFVTRAFNQYISYNYPGVTRDFLQEKLESDSQLEIRIATEIIEAMDRYSDQLNKLPRLKEFHPPERRALTYLNMKTRSQNEQMHKKTEEGSIFLKLATRVVLKGGKTSFSKYDGSFTDRSPLHEMSYAYELPRGEIYDPVGQQYMRFKWRKLSRNEVDNETDHT